METTKEINPFTKNAGIFLKTDFIDDYRLNEGNRSLIFSMFFNIVNNAVKNTPKGGEILIRSHFEDTSYNVTISDKGKG